MKALIGLIGVILATVSGLPAQAQSRENTIPSSLNNSSSPHRVDGTVPRVPRYSRFEASFTSPGAAGNPFDPAQNDVRVTFHGPRGLTVETPSFWDGIWKVRFAPTQPGSYSFAITWNGQEVQPADLAPRRFLCVSSSRPGFIRRNPGHIQHFIFDDGSPFYPLGCNQAWTSTGLPDYPGMFVKMHDTGMNWARVWMNSWDHKALDWSPDSAQSPPAGMLELNVAKRWDQIFDAADASDVRLQVTLQHHGQYTAHVDPNWASNPFNAANPGGFLQQPQDFFTDPRAIALTKAKYRYIVARWGYSDHLMGWELFNEVQNITEVRGHFEPVVAWHREMAAYLRSLDPNRHLVTTSYTPPGDPLEAGVPLDYDQPHSYVTDIISLLAGVDVPSIQRPLFWGEWGRSGGGPANGQSREFLHDGLWAGIMTPLAGAPQFWYWDAVERGDWWPVIKSASGYLAASGMSLHPDLKRVSPEITSDRRADVSFAPTRGWETTQTFRVSVSPGDGMAAGLAGVSPYVQGQAHREMTREPIVFVLNYAQPGRFILRVGQIASSGAHPQLSLDGQVAAGQDLVPVQGQRFSGEMISIDVPAGPHEVAVFNTGKDWFSIGRITLTDYAPALAVLAKGDRRSLFFWAYNRRRPASGPGPGFTPPSASPPVPPEAPSGELRFSGLADGSYTLSTWDPQAGQPLAPSRRVRVSRGQISVPVSGLENDIAGWITAR